MATEQQGVGQMTFGPVRSRPLSQEVLEPIRKAILFGQLPSGTRLLEAEIARQMGVSRVPVREALRQLEHEGLLVSSPHRGTVVAASADDEIELLFDLRAHLETFALESLLRRNTPDLCVHLQRLVEQMRSGVRTGDLVELAESDLEFHRTIVSASGYRILERLWSTMDGPIRAWLHRCLDDPSRHDLIAYTAESHQPIVDAIARGERERALALLEGHILETTRLVERGVRSADGGA